MTPQEFSDELIRIAGRNGDGLPLLKLVDGRKEQAWTAGEWKLKYVGRTDEDGTEHGEEGYIIEQWRSPEFLAASGRFTTHRHDTDGSEVIREMPSEGFYDYFLRLSDEQLRDRAGEFLETVREVWAFQKLPLREQNRLIDEHQERVRQARAAAEKKRRDDMWGFDLDQLVLVTNSAGRQQYVKRKREI
jgi:hypothetical protein